MKRIILTESQYKRLVRQNLNEQYKKIVYLNMRDAYDVNPEMLRVLEYLNYKFDRLYNKPLYVLKIEDGKVYIDTSKYTSEEIDYVKYQAKEYLSRNRNPNDSLLSNDFGFDSGIDSDYNWSEDEKVVDIEDSSKCYCYNLSTDEQIKYNCNSNLPAECGGKSEDVNITIDDDDDVVIINNDDENTTEIEDENVISYNVPVPEDQREGKFLKGQKNEKVDPKYIFNFLVNKGLKDYQACGVLGNMYWESGFNTGILGDQYTSIGICQWHNERFENLIKYSVDRKRSVTNKDIQLDFMWDEELNGVYYNNVLSPLKKSESLSEATFIWSSKFEVCQGCGDKESSEFKKRLKKAEEYFNLYVKEGEEEILDCENCISKISSETKNKYETIINKDNIVDFRWWVNQNNDRVIKLSNKYKSCCETLESKRLDTDSKEINDWSLIAFELYGNEWINSGKPKKPKSNYSTDNGNIKSENLTQINNDINGNVEYLSKEAATSFKSMFEKAKSEGVIINITDAYRPCGEPGDYEKYKNKEIRFTQWAAWEQYGGNASKAAKPNPSTESEWIRNGGGYCTSNHGWGNAIDIAGKTNGKENLWVQKNGEDYGWCLVEAKHTEGWHFTYCGSDAKNKSDYCKRCKQQKNKKEEVKNVNIDSFDPNEVNKVNVLIIGDSQSTDAWGVKKYHRYLSENKYNIKNTAIGGKNTEWMYKQLKKENLSAFDVIIIMGGGNDGHRKTTDKTAQSNLDKMYKYVKDNSNAKLIAISNPTKKFKKDYLTKYPSNELIAQHTMNSNLPDYKINANSLGEDYFYRNDKIHLDTKGQEWIYNELKKYLDNL